MKKIYIMATYTGTIFSKFLAFFSEEKYIHISLSLDKELKNVYSFGRKNPRRILPAGFIEENLKLISTVYTNSITKIYELEVTAKQHQTLKIVLKEEFINNANKYRYNIKGLPMINFNLRYQRKYHYVCSQFCAKVLIDSGIIHFDKDYSLIKPKDLVELEDLKLVYEGTIIDLLKQN
ncbi:MAG: hypothetical protein PHX04_02955 [Bacilli bacterium]|nr:hypothetical protein [Bacilli bacterium]